ncbi:GNAT family N-acetyltransferase [Pedobacter sp. N36a]|uniref:GNAT family N-acetyltransferase n=1 Tax=Pedobacter sp. N36a TaxID=2767996 RepID=UPI001656C52B|nr:GNAT family N-acetyltransferase [Pedobacter sp. N36a]MBC8986742.1 GNAT family N-acetyltransferase [Pedobacter sp. N36a]
MKIFVETDRIILREIILADAPLMFKMDSDPEVHKYLGNKPFKNISESEDNIRFIRDQYVSNGIGRWAVIDKENNEFVGSRHALQKSGLKITGHFDHEGIVCDWFEISKADWLSQ